jgi:cytochrome c-type biogenesis protein CcmE
MAGLKKRRRMQFLGVMAALLAGAAALGIYASRDAFQFFRTPAEILAETPPEGRVFRLGGLVKEGTWVHEGTEHRFAVTDTEADFPVIYSGLVPDLFAEGQGTILTGRIEGGVFVATEVLARHDEDYMPKEVADALKERGLYQPDSVRSGGS